MSGAISKTGFDAGDQGRASSGPVVTRFAPSPNGALHLGHAFSAIAAYDLAFAQAESSPHSGPPMPGRFLLRIEDIDGARSRPELADDYRNELAWLGLDWDEVPAQSTRIASYGAAAQRLYDKGLLYRCNCTRSEIAANATEQGPEGALYPGTCRPKGERSSADKALDDACAARDFGEATRGDSPLPPGDSYCWRLDMSAAQAETGALYWSDTARGEQRAAPEIFGDVVLWRKDAPASYHLAATLDDAADGITLVTRGADIFAATHIHRLLQALLGLPVPQYYHHDLLVDESGQKLAKRRGSEGLKQLQASGMDGHALAERLRRRDFPAGISPAKKV